ncbi:MAG: 3'-5' DNA helicase [Candelina mexicana]|nr:MAG: 3'-5' DNA helicase [Candelina mexicana]
MHDPGTPRYMYLEFLIGGPDFASSRNAYFAPAAAYHRSCCKRISIATEAGGEAQMAEDGEEAFDDFGDVDEEGLLLAATEAEQFTTSKLSPYVATTVDQRSKRRRLNGPQSDIVEKHSRLLRHGNIASRSGTAQKRPSEVSSFEDDTVQEAPGEDVDYVSSPSRLPHQRVAGQQPGLRQTTLFGGTVGPTEPDPSEALRRNWPLANKDEAPTHHELDEETLRTWVYPTNLGTIRDYQYSIVQRGLYHNLLVALPTGLGKTFIAATIMLNWFRWTVSSQIVFVAPTKPLVSQQVQACFGIAGIPRSQTTLLTGATPPGVRAEEWLNKRVFFMTPQTLINDLKTGCCDPKKIVLVVVDEAHRATGGYAYVEVVNFIQRFNTSFRVLALTATPGATVEAVQQVIDGLNISRVEIRTEESIDIRQYVHTRKTETILFDYSEEMVMLMDLFSQSMQPILDKLNQQNAYWAKDPMTLTAFGLTEARQKWSNSPAGRNANFSLKGLVNTIFTALASLAHAIELLKYHGIGPFYHNLLRFRNETQSGEKGSKYRKQVIESPHFQKMMTRVQSWINDANFVGHPKLDYLQNVVINHFLDAGEGRGAARGAPPSNTRIMIFAHYRDSAEEVVRVLKRNEPMIRPHVFVGQASAKGSEGMDQKKQQDIIEKFKQGIYNTIVATSIGEEGLDIGEVDLIICYDSSASPIRMLQRMGRTGRKRAGNIVLLLMRGKEESSFIRAKDNYEKMQHMIATGARFAFHEDRSPRIIPRTVQPLVDKRFIDIPIENSQPDLPEPRKRAKAPKRPPKKFHMPDGVRMGFTKASRLKAQHWDAATDNEGEGSSTDQGHGHLPHRARKSLIEPEPLPSLDDVLLSTAEEKDLDRRYQHLCGEDGVHTVTCPRLGGEGARQRSLRKTEYVTHGRVTKRAVSMLNTIHSFGEEELDRLARFKHSEDRATALPLSRSPSPDFASISDSSGVPLSSHKEKDVVTSDRVGLITSEHNKSRHRQKGTLQSDDESDSQSDSHSDINNFVVDDLVADDGLESSITVSPAPSADLEKRFHISPHRRRSSDSDSDEELPDFLALVQKPTTSPMIVTAQEILENCMPPMASQRKGRRMVVEDSSDDD